MNITISKADTIVGPVTVGQELLSLLNTLIEKVMVGEPEDADGERIQEVKIYDKFIGN